MQSRRLQLAFHPSMYVGQSHRILAYAIAFMGLIMIVGGVWGLFLLVKSTVRPPLRYFAMAIGMISGGIAMGGLAQALRLLVGISGHG